MATQLACTSSDRSGAPMNEYRARLITPGSYLMGTLRDLTSSGGRVFLNNPPKPGATVLLQWSREERLCTVVDADAFSCDLTFEDETVCDEARSDPTAGVQSSLVKARPRMGKRLPAALRGAVPTTTPDGWSIVLPRPSESGGLGRRSLGCGEAMFFFGSPVAHVIAYLAFRDDDSRVARSKLPPRNSVIPAGQKRGRLSRLIARR